MRSRHVSMVKLVVFCFSYRLTAMILKTRKDETNYTYSGDFKLPDSNDCMIVAKVLVTSLEWSFWKMKRSKPLLISLTKERTSVTPTSFSSSTEGTHEPSKSLSDANKIFSENLITRSTIEYRH